MASIIGLNNIGLPRFSPALPEQDARALNNYLFQLEEQLNYILTNLGPENMNEETSAFFGERGQKKKEG